MELFKELDQDVILDAILFVLEEFAFMFGDPVSEEGQDLLNKKCYYGQINFTGLVCGKIEIVLEEVLTVKLAANALGLQDDDPLALDEQQDVVRELLNIICGRIITGCFGEEMVFDLDVPNVSILKQNDLEQLNTGSGNQFIDVENHMLLIKGTLFDECNKRELNLNRKLTTLKILKNISI
ncbi:chemotaxis protein CheX [bacterium]|nr:chemotaxis protein CheX [bacterium]